LGFVRGALWSLCMALACACCLPCAACWASTPCHGVRITISSATRARYRSRREWCYGLPSPGPCEKTQRGVCVCVCRCVRLFEVHVPPSWLHLFSKPFAWYKVSHGSVGSLTTVAQRYLAFLVSQYVCVLVCACVCLCVLARACMCACHAPHRQVPLPYAAPNGPSVLPVRGHAVRLGGGRPHR
jgi:hypothetical protein